MSRYASYGQLDTQKSTDGDFSFRGIDMKHDRGVLESGMVAKSINKRLRTGIAETRPGTRTPADFNPGFVNRLQGSMVYSNPNGTEQLLVAEGARNFVWALQDGFAPKQVPITGGGVPLANNFAVWFVQAFDKVLLLRPGITPLEWNGLDYVGGFKPVVKSDPADTSTVLIGGTEYAIPFQSRVLYHGPLKDDIAMSDVLDYTSYDPVLAVFRINAGESDRIVMMHGYSKESILVFMRRSIHRFSNFTTDPSLAAQDIVSSELGCVGREAAVQVGADMIFLSRAGFYRVNQVFENQTISAPVPISDLISPMLEGIDWELIPYIGMVSMAMLGDYVYAAVPFGATFPATILVYNTVTSQWESIDAWEDDAFYINQLRVTLFNGERRLFAINARFAHIALLYEGITDQTVHAGLDFPPATPMTNPVNDILETRGYGLRNQYGQPAGLGDWKRFTRLGVSLRTRHPSATISALTDGYNEQKIITTTPIVKSTNKSYIFGKPFPVGGDPNAPYHEDYYQGETEWVAQDMSNLLPGFIDLLPAVDAEMLGGPTTESLEKRMLRAMGRWCSIRVNNTQGACDVLGCTVELEESRRDTLTVA